MCEKRERESERERKREKDRERVKRTGEKLREVPCVKVLPYGYTKLCVNVPVWVK